MKKSKLVKILALSAIFTASVASMAACRKKDEHTLTLIEGQAATCTTDGFESYYMCSHCDLIFADAEGKTETNLEAVKINRLGHDMTKHDAVAAECSKPGHIEYYTCSRENGKYFDANGNEITDIVTTKTHDFSGSGAHAYVQPTTEAEGSEAYWQCNDCHNVYADANGDRQTTVEDMKIDRVKENLDGVLTDGFYNTEHALVIGGASQKSDFVGMRVNGKKETDGLYLHITADYNTSADDQQGDHGKIGVLVNFRNQNDLHLPGGLGTCLEQTVYFELYLSGRVTFHDSNTVKYFNTKTNTEEGKAKYTTTWELFLSYADLAAANGGKLAEAFEQKDGKTALKQSYAPLMSFIGNMTHSPDDKFENPPAASVKDGDAKCDEKDNNSWLIWYSHGYGDWGVEQKYMALGKEGFSMTVPRAVDTYTVNKNDPANATVVVPETVNFNEAITGSVTVAEGYVLSGIRANGKVVATKGEPASGNVYEYSIPVSEIGLEWYETVIDLEFVITKLEFENVSFTLEGIAGGKTSAIPSGTEVVLENEFGDKYLATVGANGAVSVENVLCQDYAVKVPDYLEGRVDVVKGETIGTVTLGYHFAHNAGDRADLVDLTDMNEENASITLGAQGENGVDKHTIAAQIKLSEEMKNAKAYVLYTTVTVNGEVKNDTGKWLQRFAIRFAEGDAGNTYNNKFVVWWDDLGLNSNPSAIWANDGTTCGGGADRQATFEWLASNVMDGLQLKIVRNGGYIAISAYNLDDETWYTLLEGATSESAKNDITFFVSGESYTFSEISFEKLQEIDRTLPVGETAGKLEHLKASNGDLFFVNGTIATEAELTLTAASMSVSVNAFEKDGETPVTLADGTEIKLVGKWQTYTYTVGGSAITEMLEDEYEAFLYGYAKVKFTVTEGAEISIKLVKTDVYVTTDQVTVDGEDGTISIAAQDKNADKNWTGGAEPVIAQDIGNHLVFETTIRMGNIEEGWTGHSTEQRYAIQMTESGKGFYLWSWKHGASKTAVRELKSLTDCMAEGEIVNGNEAGNGWIYDALLSNDGLQVRVIRLGDTLILAAVKDGEFVQVGSMECDENDKTKIVVYGVTASFEFSDYSANKLAFVEAKDASTAAAGNIAHYTDGTNYYLPDGTVTTEQAVTIPQIVEKAVEIAVKVIGTDGNELANADLSAVKITLTGEYDYNKNVYTELSVADGKLVLADGKIYAGTYSVIVNGYAVDAITVGEDTETLTLNLYQIAGYQVVEATKTHKPESVITGLNTNGVTVKLVGCKSDDWAEYNNPVPEATLTLPAEIASSKNVTLEFTLKLSNQGFWGANAFGVSLVGDYGGFILRTFAADNTEIDVSELYAQKLCEDNMKFLGKNAWVKGLAVGENGVNVRVVRTGTALALFAQNAESEWIKLFTASCSADAETQIKFMGAASDFEVSDIVVCTAPAAFSSPDGYVKASADIVYHKYVAPTVQKEGCNAYYSVGDAIYTVKGEKTTLDALKIEKISAIAVDVTVKVIGTDGNEIADADLSAVKVTLTGEFEYNRNLYTNLSIVDGKLVLADGKIYAGTYSVIVNGYAVDAITVGEDTETLTLNLYQIAGYQIVGVTKTGSAEVAVSTDGATVTVKSAGNNYENWAGVAELGIPETVKNSKNVSVEFTLKDTLESTLQDAWAARRFGVTMQGANGGFMCFTPTANEASLYVMGANPGAEDKTTKVEYHALASLLRSQDGVSMRVVRTGGKVAVFAKIESAWVKIGTFNCNADGETQIKFYGVGDTWQFSDVIVCTAPAEFAAPDGYVKASGNIVYHKYVAPTVQAEGCNAYYSVDDAIYTVKGEKTTLDALKIEKISAIAVDVTVKVFGTDGNEIADADLSAVKVTLTGEFEYNKNLYTNLAIVDGKLVLADGKIYAGAYSVVVNGYAVVLDGSVVDAITVGEDADTLTLNLYQIAGYQIVEANKSYRTESVITELNTNGVTVKLSGAKGDFADWGAAVPEATLGLPEAIQNSNVVSVEFNVKATNGGHWACNAFGVSMVEGYKGFGIYLSGFDKDDSRVFAVYAQKLRENDENMTFLGDYAWLETLMRGSENGLNIRVVRAGATLTLYAQNAENAWVKIAETTCDANAKTQIKLMGQAADYEITNVVVSTASVAFSTEKYVKVSGDIVYHKYVAPTIQADGNIAYYSVDGAVYTVNGEKTTLDAVKLDKLSATQITITVKGYKDGAETLLNGTVSATGEYETSFEDTLVNGVATVDAYLVKYTLSVDGYLAKEFTVEAGKTEYEIVLVYDFARATFDSEKVDLSKMNEANHEIKITGNKGQFENWGGPVPEAKLSLSQNLVNATNVKLEFNLKATNSNDEFNNAFGISMVEGYKGAAFSFFRTSTKGVKMFPLHAQKLGEDGWGDDGTEFPWLEELLYGTDGVNLRLVRTGGSIKLFAQNAENEWIEIYSVECDADAKTDIRFLANGSDFTITDIVVEEYVAG